jgi:endonuclease YncB( thermonuclease family)
MTEKTAEINSPDYQLHLKTITDICDSSRLTLVQMYWLIGNRISEIAENGTGYGSALIETLSRDLSHRYGKGYSKTNLKNMRLFYRIYKKNQLSPEIEWSSYVLLIGVKNPRTREELEKRIIEKSLTTNLLKLELARISLAESMSQNRVAPELIFTRGKLYTYRLAESRGIYTGQESITIDCGFNIHRIIKPEKISIINSPGFIESHKKKNTYSIREAPHVKPDEIYTYIAAIEKIIDGDTILAVIDCGFSTTLRMRLRLRGIDAPEIDTKEGVKARNFIVKALEQTPLIGIKTYKADKYSRYLADIFYLPGETSPHKIISSGEFLNQQLLDNGLAIKA